MRRIQLSETGLTGDWIAKIQTTEGIHGIARLQNSQSGVRRWVVFGPGCETQTFDALRAAALEANDKVLEWYGKPAVFGAAVTPAGPVRVRPGSRTAQAVALVQQEGKTPHAAAATLGINASAVYRALQRRETPPCPHCGRSM